MDPSSELILNLARLQARLSKQLDRRLGIHGLGLTEFSALLRLDAAEGGSMRRLDLAEALSLSASGVTRLINPMEKIGLVGKEAFPRDARVSLVKLTEAGQRVLGEVRATFDHGARDLLEPLSSEQREQLRALVDQLLQG